MKKKTILGVVLWCIALACCLLLADKLMRRDDSARKYDAFYAEARDFDVLFFGTSRVLDAVQPMELWRDYGFTSYNMGNNSEPLGATRWVLDLAMDFHKPKIAVFDVFYMTHAINEAWAYSFRHFFLDSVPLSRAKVKAVKATLPEDQWLEFLMPFSLYHGRWDEIFAGKTERMVQCERYMMGGELRTGSVARTDGQFTEEMAEETLPGEAALREMAVLCRENGVEPVFVALPGHAYEREQKAMNAVARIAQELDVPFVNMLRAGVIDYQTDCNDEMGHLNPVGASKTTAYLGQWLTEHYDLPDLRGEKSLAHWDENLRLYEAERARLLTNSASLVE